MSHLVIVESPSKAKTINKYLGKDFEVVSSIGHIRDLPKSNKNAIDIENGFKPFYEISPDKIKVVSNIVSKARSSESIILAPDPDREGEAIAWHLAEILREELGDKVLKKIKRVTFNSITKDVIEEAMKSPRDIDQDLRQAQEARRVLDRLMGYELSGLIWKKVRYGLSAGRVQSPALRILMEKEREIRAFNPENYFVITGEFAKDAKVKTTFPLICSEEPNSQERSDEILNLSKKESWVVSDIKETQAQRKPRAPFTTSTLQQSASNILGFSPSRTMRAAQKLYQAGHITYMRTDSTHIHPKAQNELYSLAQKLFGKEYAQKNAFSKKSKNAQEAHEAIRPTVISATKQRGTSSDEKAVYQLIWQRTLASQMAPAQIVRTKLIATCGNKSVPEFTTKGQRILFEGWMMADPTGRSSEVTLPAISKGQNIDLRDITSEEKWTQPPNRYSEAGLIKELEKRGIGRPSTYASIIQTIQNRGYVTKDGRTLIPTDTGDVVSSFLEEHFETYIGDTFTAEMEDSLDEIARGNQGYLQTLTKFYTPFHDHIDAKQDIEKLTNLGPADKKFKCPVCKKSMVIKLGKTGKFLSCSNFPECDGALTIDGKELGKAEPLGNDPETGMPIFVFEGRFGPYVQLGQNPDPKDKKAPKPKRASIPKDINSEEITIDQAVHLLILPRTLGQHPETGEDVISNIGRFGPYVGHGKEFRSLKKSSGLDPYTITLDEAIKVLKEPKKLPKGVELVRLLGKHPKTNKDVRILKSKSGLFVQKGLKRIYLPDNFKTDEATIEDIIAIIKAS